MDTKTLSFFQGLGWPILAHKTMTQTLINTDKQQTIEHPNGEQDSVTNLDASCSLISTLAAASKLLIKSAQHQGFIYLLILKHDLCPPLATVPLYTVQRTNKPISVQNSEWAKSDIRTATQRNTFRTLQSPRTISYGSHICYFRKKGTTNGLKIDIVEADSINKFSCISTGLNRVQNFLMHYLSTTKLMNVKCLSPLQDSDFCPKNSS